MLINAEAATGGVQKEALAQLFSCEFCEISKNTVSYTAPQGDCFFSCC